MSENAVLEQALAYAGMDWAVFPVVANQKVPLTPNGFHAASTDENTIREWFTRYPEANIGVATGASGLVVVDVDTKNNGDQTFEDLRGELGPDVFNTVTAQTPSGGQHYVFRRNGTAVKSGTHVLGQGIDIRAEGGYFVVAPSFFNGKPYTWEAEYSPLDRTPAEFPSELNDKIVRKAIAAPLSESGQIPDGERNATLASIAGSLRRRGLDFDEILGALSVVNVKRCRPQLDEPDLARIVQSICRYAPAEQSAVVEMPRTVDATELLASKYIPPTFHVEHLIPERAIVLLSADTGGAKTSFMLHTAASMALAFPVAKRFGVSLSERPVLFLNGEMGTDTLKRFLHANVAGLGVESLPRGLIFQGAGGVADPFVARGNAEALRALVARDRPRAVFIDTFRALFDADESKASEVRPVFDTLRQITNEWDCSIIVSHHVRKLSVVSNGARERVSGSRDLIAAVDIHLAAKSPSGQPMTALLLDKTRTPHEGVAAGTEWPITASWVDGSPPLSTFTAGPPSTGEGASAVDAAKQEVRDLLETDGPKTKADLGAKNGTRRRAIEKMLEDGEIQQTGKSGRAFIYGLPEHAH